jgi:hypothetical protein
LRLGIAVNEIALDTKVNEVRENINGFRLIAMFLVAIFSAFTARANNSILLANSLSVSLPISVKPRFDYSVKAMMETSRTLSENDHVVWSGLYEASLGIADVKSQISGFVNATYGREYSYALEDGTDGSFKNLTLGVRRSWASGRNYENNFFDHVNVGANYLPPVNADQGRATFLGATGPVISVDKKFGRLLLGEELGYSRRFYEYDIQSDGTVNSPDLYTARTLLGLDITSTIALTAIYIYKYSVSFQGVGRGIDSTGFEIGYSPTKLLSFAVGLSTDRISTLSPDGQANDN